MQRVDPTSSRYDLVVLGELNADLILSGNVVPVFGQVEQVVSRADLTLGSSAVIFACGAARLGLRTAFIGKVGDDLFGHYMLESMAGRGIDVDGVAVDSEIQTGLSVILNRGNDRAILTYPGSIPELTRADIDFSLIQRARHLHLSGFYLLTKLRPDIPDLFEQAHGLGLTTSLDTNYDPDETWNGPLQRVLPHVDLFLPNETEAQGVSGGAGVEEALDWLRERIPVVSIKLGARGALAADHQRVISLKAVTLPVQDTVGAGDSFAAGFVYAYLQGWELERSLQLATACGSLSTGSAGGTAGQPTLVEATAFVREHYDLGDSLKDG